MDRQTAIGKIKKCLALAKSAGGNEAAAALRQARKLMDQFGIAGTGAALADVSENHVRASAKRRPSQWEAVLAATVAYAFGCATLLQASEHTGDWIFVGTGQRSVVAAYAFAVLLRQVKKARTDYVTQALARCKPAIRTRRADLFCDAWVSAVARSVRAFADGGVDHSPQVQQYLELRFPETQNLRPTDRNAERERMRAHELRDLRAGHVAGKNARLNQGLAAANTSAPLALPTAPLQLRQLELEL